MPITLRSLTRKPKPPTPPAADPRYARVMQQLGQKAAKVKAHPTPAKKAEEAAKAAKGPPNEKTAGAKGKQVDKIKDAKTKKPEPDSFLSLLRAEIEKAMPKTLDDTSKFMKGGDAAALKGGLKGNVAQQKQAATGDTSQSTKQTPSTAGVPGKESQAIPDEAAPPRPDVPAGDAMPAPKPDADVSVQDSKQDTEAAMADAEVTEDQCKKANDSRFSAVLESKGQVAKQADAAPGQYRSAEKGVLNNAVAGARASGRAGAAAMMGVKGRSKSNVLTRQQAAKQKDEAERKKVADTVEAIYTKTKTAVETKLAALDDEVNAIFDSGTDAALAAMKSYTEARIDAYKDDRYSGLRGKARWIRDQFKGLPEAANRFYVEGRNLFARLMDAVIVRVANLVEQRLREAKALVAAGQAEIKKYVDSLPKNLKSVGQAAQKEVGDRFKELERGIEDKKGQLASQLAQKYKEAFDKADKALKEIQDSNKGLVQKFVEKLGEIIKIIREFKGKLMAALRKGWSVIKGILADPIGFLGNLIAALKAGFNQFKANIGKWLLKGIIGWLFGALAEAGVTPPADFSLPSILKLVLQILGITYERMREKAVKLLGPAAVAVIEQLVKYVQTLVTGGPAALWAQVQGDLADLKERVLGDIRTMIITEVIKAAVLKIVSMFNPVGAFVQAVLAIYNTVMFVVEQASRIAALVSSVIDSVAAIAGGAIDAAAKRIEEALGAAIPIVIGFLARLVGVGGLPKKATAVVKKVQTAVDKAIDKLLGKAIGFVKKLFSSGKAKDPADQQKRLNEGVAAAKAAVTRFSGKRVGAKLIRPLLVAIKFRYKLTALEPVQRGDKWAIRGAVNPDKVEPTDVNAPSTEATAKLEAAAKAAEKAAKASEAGKKATRTGEAREAAKRAEVDPRPGVIPLPTKPEGTTQGPGFDRALLLREGEEDVTELIDEKAGSSPRAVKVRSATRGPGQTPRPIPNKPRIPVPPGSGAAINMILNDPAVARQVATGQAVMVRGEGEAARLIENKMSSFTENVKENFRNMFANMDAAIASGKLDPTTKARVQAIRSGAGGVLRYVVSVEQKKNWPPNQDKVARALIEQAFADLMAGCADLKTKLDIEIREDKKKSGE